MAAATGGGEQNDMTVSSMFERQHGELVREASELAASCGADVTVLAVSPRFSAPRVTQFNCVGEVLERAVVRPEEVARMGLDEVVALEEWLRRLRLLVLWRIKEEERAEAAADQPLRRIYDNVL
ncbi:hypothetical protein E2562_000391 [Oryza meyeriana var. granulata]|uniref:Uncharacterized protein n=1 Tax=Oryza meyeriana var. granulata TaxID=110450 RepID=A0A6G1CDG8_9ORYZ|nr:hypothetical protein E2562_000391 [Oryza meyeriana var. granulata]